jgi:hypothetical protein
MAVYRGHDARQNIFQQPAIIAKNATVKELVNVTFGRGQAKIC